MHQSSATSRKWKARSEVECRVHARLDERVADSRRARILYDALRYRMVAGILGRVIESFADAETARIWNGRRSRRLPSEIQPVALRKLRMLNQARALADLRMPPGNRLEILRGERRGQYSIRINLQWRICFRWREGAAQDVEIVDYHD